MINKRLLVMRNNSYIFCSRATMGGEYMTIIYKRNKYEFGFGSTEEYSITKLYLLFLQSYYEQ